MHDNKFKTGFLSGNALKLLAAAFMLTDHIGLILLPQYTILRIIGRLAFPIFAFMISEGCFYTRNKTKYFFDIFSLAIVCQIVYYIVEGSLNLGILMTFSLSILMIYSLENFKEKVFSQNSSPGEQITSFSVFLFTVAVVYVFNVYFDIDYGFWGCMTPVFASLFRMTGQGVNDNLKRYDCLVVHVLMLMLALIILASQLGVYQFYSLFAVPLLLAYSGKRGRIKLKNFFYVFYPAHLVILQLINMLMKF